MCINFFFTINQRVVALHITMPAIWSYSSMRMRLTSPGLMLVLSSPWETKTDFSTSTVLHTYSPASYLTSYPAPGRQSTPPYSRVLNMPLVYEIFLQISATLNLQRSSCVTIPCAICIVKDSIKQKRSKPIDMRFHWVHDRVRQGQFYITISCIKSADNIADYFTKNLDPIKHKFFMQFLVPNNTTL
jgi:hypothetical protein